MRFGDVDLAVNLNYADLCSGSDLGPKNAPVFSWMAPQTPASLSWLVVEGRLLLICVAVNLTMAG